MSSRKEKSRKPIHDELPSSVLSTFVCDLKTGSILGEPHFHWASRDTFSRLESVALGGLDVNIELVDVAKKIWAYCDMSVGFNAAPRIASEIGSSLSEVLRCCVSAAQSYYEYTIREQVEFSYSSMSQHGFIAEDFAFEVDSVPGLSYSDLNYICSLYDLHEGAARSYSFACSSLLYSSGITDVSRVEYFYVTSRLPCLFSEALMSMRGGIEYALNSHAIVVDYEE